MQTMEVTQKNWVVIDGINGVNVYPHDDFTIVQAIDEYGYEGVTSVEIQYGYGGRMIMPGYLDCTEWSTVFETEEACIRHLSELYDDETPEHPAYCECANCMNNLGD